MNNNVNIIIEKLKELPRIRAGKKSIVALTNNTVNMSIEDFDKAAEYIWINNLVRVLKVEHEGKYIIKFFVDIA